MQTRLKENNRMLESQRSNIERDKLIENSKNIKFDEIIKKTPQKLIL